MRIHRLLLTTLLTSGAIAACTPPAPPPPDTAAVKVAIEAANTRFTAAIKKGDTIAMVADYDANAMVMAPGGPAASGSAAVARWMGGMIATLTAKEFNLKIGDVIVTGDYAIETGSYDMVLTPKKGKDIPDKGKYVVVWKKQADGSWKILRDIWNTDVAPKA